MALLDVKDDKYSLNGVILDAKYDHTRGTKTSHIESAVDRKPQKKAR